MINLRFMLWYRLGGLASIIVLAYRKPELLSLGVTHCMWFICIPN